MKLTTLQQARDHFTTGSGRSITLEAADGTTINCVSLIQAESFYSRYPEVKAAPEPAPVAKKAAKKAPAKTTAAKK